MFILLGLILGHYRGNKLNNLHTTRIAVPNDETGIYSQIEIKSGLNIDQVEVELDMVDSDLRDVQVTLISPDGTRSILMDNLSVQAAANDNGRAIKLKKAS
jgi:subtilisin-like proprotein convertase family protein